MNTPEYYMLEAVKEAKASADAGHGKPFGAVVVKNGEIIGRGANRVFQTGDPSEHAELAAMREACKKLGQLSLAGCELYATGQPCLMCLGAIFTTQLPVLYYANTYEDAEKLGYTGGGATESLAQTLGYAGAFSGNFGSSPALKVILLPLPEASDLFTAWAAKGRSL